MIHQIITISPDIQSGTPVFTGTRVPIKNLFDYLKGGDTINEFLDDFPSVKREQVVQLITFSEKIFSYQNTDYDQNNTFGRKLTETT
jgi:uncharacterized protein (DUF433 family)